MNCPQCKTALRKAMYEGVSIHSCNGCGGEFIGPSELACVVKARETAFGQQLKKLYESHKPMFGVPNNEVNRNLTCPGCKGTMLLVNYGTDSGIGVDRCDDCGGVWLDHEELEKVQLVMENWQDRAPSQLRAIATQLEQARIQIAEKTSRTFRGSRFSFVNALINRLLDAA